MTTAAAGAAAATSETGAPAAAGAAKGDDGKGGAAAGAAADAKGAEGKGGEAGAAGAAGKGSVAAGEVKTPEGAPEKYELKIADGARLPKFMLPHIEENARKANWTNADAQAAVDESESVLQVISDQWATETKADKELGGDKLEATQQLTKAGIDFLFPKGDPHREGFIEFLNRGGAGNNIHVVRALARIGKQQREDGNVSGSGAGGDAPKAPEDVLYKTTPSSS